MRDTCTRLKGTCVLPKVCGVGVCVLISWEFVAPSFHREQRESEPEDFCLLPLHLKEPAPSSLVQGSVPRSTCTSCLSIESQDSDLLFK